MQISMTGSHGDMRHKPLSFIRLRPSFIFLIMAAIMISSCQSAPDTITPAASTPTPSAAIENQPIPGGPMLLRAGISLRSVAKVGVGSIKLALHPLTGDIYILSPGSGLTLIKLSQSNNLKKIASPTVIIENAQLSGMAFGSDGTLYVVANRKVDNIHTQAIIRKGIQNVDGNFQWKTLAQTEPYPLSNTYYDHLYNGIVVSADGQWVYVSAGSRTEHGEVEDNAGAFPHLRDVALTARILRIPASAEDLLLPNDETALSSQGLIFARGTRNAYDMAFAPNGDLFAVDNGPDADYPDELNWIREGLHYGFPWRFGVQDNPQRLKNYDAKKDKHLQSGFYATDNGLYHNDPSFPQPPGAFTDPVVNLGPDAMKYRGDDGKEYDAYKQGKSLSTFTPHRAPLGLVFASNDNLPLEWRSDGDTLSAFILSWGAAGGTLSDKGQDLLHLQLTKNGDNYESVTTQIAREFQNPIDAVLIKNRLYVLNYGSDGILWELTFE